jgi:hypothetical protein
VARQPSLPGMDMSIDRAALYEAWLKLPNRSSNFEQALQDEPVLKCLVIMAGLNQAPRRRRKHA